MINYQLLFQVKMLKNYTNIFFELLSNSHSKSYMSLLDSEVNHSMFWKKGNYSETFFMSCNTVEC